MPSNLKASCWSSHDVSQELPEAEMHFALCCFQILYDCAADCGADALSVDEGQEASRAVDVVHLIGAVLEESPHNRQSMVQISGESPSASWTPSPALALRLRA